MVVLFLFWGESRLVVGLLAWEVALNGAWGGLPLAEAGVDEESFEFVGFVRN